jgi:hypothetical protein
MIISLFIYVYFLLYFIPFLSQAICCAASHAFTISVRQFIHWNDRKLDRHQV